MAVASADYLSLSRVLVMRMEFYVAKVYKCPCRMSLRRKCEGVRTCSSWKG